MIVDNTKFLPMNKRKVLTTGILLASWALTYRCAAQTFDANAAFKINELSGSETTSLFGPFSVGYLDRLVPNSFATFTSGEHTNAFAGNANTQGFLTVNNVLVPAVAVNVSTAPNSGFFGLDAGEIFLHPGGRGANGFDAPLFDGVMRFSAPTTSFYTIAGTFRSLDSGVTLNTIFRNGVPELNIIDAGNFNLTLQLTAGDTIDFASNAGTDGIGGDSTALRATLTTTGAPPPRQRVNIDFDGKRPGDASNAGTYLGVGAAGGGSFFNSIEADSTGGNDNLTVSGVNLLSDIGGATTVGFTIGTVAGDHEPTQTFQPAALFDDYIFNHTAGNTAPAGGSPFTISGLGDAATADLYFYLNGFNSGTISLGNFAGNGVAGNYNGLNAQAFLGVPVVNGEVTGFFGANGAVSVLSGLTVSTTVGTIYWNVNANGLWSVGANWVGNTAPNAVGAAAALGGGNGATITVDGAFTAGRCRLIIRPRLTPSRPGRAQTSRSITERRCRLLPFPLGATSFKHR